MLSFCLDYLHGVLLAAKYNVDYGRIIETFALFYAYHCNVEPIMMLFKAGSPSRATRCAPKLVLTRLTVQEPMN